MIFLLKAGGSRVLAFRIDGVRLIFPTSRAQQCEKLQNGVFQGGRVWASRFECGAVYGSCWFSDLRGVRFLDERRWVFRGFEAMKQSVGFPLKCQAIGFGLPGRGDVKRVYGLKRNGQQFLDARLPGQ